MNAVTIFIAFLMLNISFAAVGMSGIFPVDFPVMNVNLIVLSQIVITIGSFAAGAVASFAGYDPLKVTTLTFLAGQVLTIYGTSSKILLSIGSLIDAGSVGYGTFFMGVIITLSTLSFIFFLYQVATQPWRGIRG